MSLSIDPFNEAMSASSRAGAPEESSGQSLTAGSAEEEYYRMGSRKAKQRYSGFIELHSGVGFLDPSETDCQG